MLGDNPRVAELLLLLWDASPREDGIAIVELPEALRDEALLTAIKSAHLIDIARRNHCHHGGGVHRKLVMEPGWNVAQLDKPDCKQVWEVVREAMNEQVEDEIRYRIRLTLLGSREASQLALKRESEASESKATQTSEPSMPSDFADLRKWLETTQAPTGKGKVILMAILEAKGRLPVSEIPDLVGWLDHESPWNSARLRLNKKMKAAGLAYGIVTHDHCAVIEASQNIKPVNDTPAARSKRAHKQRAKRPRNDR